MKAILAAGGMAGLLIFAAQAQGERSSASPAAPKAEPQLDWSEWTSSRPAPPEAAQPPAAGPVPAMDSAEPDVADAHWMALTMWGEARGQGEAGMRAVGHVIENRRRSGLHGAFVTDTVSEAFQFSCWNPADPNREAMMNVLELPEGSHEHLMWLAARRLADEIMSGRSSDPTGGALFYHTNAVAPRWSRGIEPVRRIGTHLFFTAARKA